MDDFKLAVMINLLKCKMYKCPNEFCGIKWYSWGACSTLQCNSVSPGNRQTMALRVGTGGEVSEWVLQRGGGGIVT